MDRRQALSLRGITFSIDMIDVAYSRLVETLEKLSEPEYKDLYGSSVEALLDAWAIVDHVHRLRGLLQQMPGVKRSPEFRLFLERTATFETFRNTIQHLREEIRDMAVNQQAVWGAVSWLTALDPKLTLLRSSCVQYGAMINSGEAILFPVAGLMRSRIDQVRLTHVGHEVGLSDGAWEIHQFSKKLEIALKKQLADVAENVSYQGAVQIISLDIAPDWSQDQSAINTESNSSPDK